jgi:hypothetical protein
MLSILFGAAKKGYASYAWGRDPVKGAGEAVGKPTARR